MKRNSNRVDIRVIDGPQKLAEIAAEFLCAKAVQATKKKNRFMVALSGGSTPRLFHQLLKTEKFKNGVPWQKTHLFWVDDRCVTPEDPASNYGAAKGDFIDQVEIPTHQVYPMPTTMAPGRGAEQYEKTILSAFGGHKEETVSFDLIFLGMGDDGHTGSLFPGQESLWKKDRLVIAVKGGNPDVDRLSMNFPLINQARHVVILVSGRKKAGLINKVLTSNRQDYPVQKVRPVNGKLSWLLDNQSSLYLPGDLLKNDVSMVRQ